MPELAIGDPSRVPGYRLAARKRFGLATNRRSSPGLSGALLVPLRSIAGSSLDYSGGLEVAYEPCAVRA
jgi:hypothetical protein